MGEPLLRGAEPACLLAADGRARQRPTRLSANDKAAILSRAETTTLRELAADFGVSHETIRKVLRSRERVRLAGC